MTREKQAEAEQKKATRQAAELTTIRLRLNYASASSVKKLLETARVISSEGTVDIDERTNILILKDTPKSLADAQEVIADLDKPEPQVEIEAKIMQTNRDTARALGVQWGFNGRLSPELGNTTGAAFPNRGTLGGRVGQGSTVQGPESLNTAVNMPVVGATSALGLSMGAVNGAFGIDVAITALEREGKVKILSTPRVTTQNNIPAEITQGAQIPIQVVANNTITVQFKDAALTLRVTPQITAANTVIMSIFLENATPNYTETSPAQPIPSIDTQRAVTSVLMEDGETTVIGGIYTRLESHTEVRTPLLHRIPLLGWLFKTENRQDDNRELLIFITPRIAR
jgi:type IV pilus assembly protein PilQ